MTEMKLIFQHNPVSRYQNGTILKITGARMTEVVSGDKRSYDV